MPRRRTRCKRPHRTGSYYQCGDRHVIQWIGADGKRRTKSFRDKEEALTSLAIKTGEAAQGLVDGHEPTENLGPLADCWLDGRRARRGHYAERSRWVLHLRQLLGDLQPDEVTPGVLKEVLRTLRGKGLSNGTLRLCVAMLSSLYSDLVEDGVAGTNPARGLSRKTREEFLWPQGDHRATPWLERTEDVLRLHVWLFERAPSVARAYAVGALAGLRTSEVRALSWADVNFADATIQVRRQVERRTGREAELLSDDGTSVTKSGQERIVPMSNLLRSLLDGTPVMADLVCPPSGRGRHFRDNRFLDEHGMAELLRQGLADLGLPKMNWYQATRHTFASQWVAAGGDIRKLSEMMGHSSVLVTERHYVHLAPGRFTDEDRARVGVSRT